MLGGFKMRKQKPLGRVDYEFFQDMKKMAKVRLDKGLAKFNPKELSLAEMTRLLRRTEGYKLSLEELSFKPKKEDLKK
jgi:hypothetical protein